ncbi:Protein CBG26810 [Caenorhabditis briggsae]|uniref:Protein CBG26810 n=1 Tax=Caenorhabditis briggsae TaxID=6238 RepID=B6IIC6_CAEBR|nr:Protein CBG26810 [Caenorhabditis briggsae]CAR99656.1 Protein CBG26810 [Caenorhabditis briggsae]
MVRPEFSLFLFTSSYGFFVSLSLRFSSLYG